MQIIADWHTHSSYSDGQMKPEEIVAAAARRGLEEVAITDHGPSGMFIGVKVPEVYLELKKQAAELEEKYSISVLVGAEANVIGLSGEIDIPSEIVRELDILIIGLHPQVWCKPFIETLNWIFPNWLGRYSERLRYRMEKTNTQALVAAIHKNPLTFVSHPNLMMVVDLEEVAKACSEKGCAMEINSGHHYDRDKIVLAALKWGVPLVVNSDAHFPETVGDLTEGLALLKKYQVSSEQLLNSKKIITAIRSLFSRKSLIFSGAEWYKPVARRIN